MSIRLKVTASGQVSVPADIRRRWGTAYVTAEDRGDHLVLRPAPEIPLEEVFAAFAADAREVDSVEAIRADERTADRAGERVRR